MDKIKPAHKIIHDDILYKIQSGEYQPGDRLPTENELTKKFRASKSPVRQALDTLRMKGLVYSHPGKGTFVSPKSQDSQTWTLTSIQDIIGLGVETRYQLHDFTPDQTSEELDRLFHLKEGKYIRIRGLRLFKDQPIYFVNLFVPQEIGRKLQVTELASCPVIVALEKKLNIHLKKCIQTISASLADPSLAQILKVSNKSPLLNIERVYFTDNEEAIVWANSFYRPDLFKYRSVLSRG